MTGSRPPGGCWITTSTPPPALRLCWPARPAAPRSAGAAPAAVPVLAGREQALAWARAERTSLLACLDQATAAGQHARVIALTAGLAGLLRYDGPWDEAITRHATAVQAARQLGDRPGQALALTDLGDVRRPTGDYPGAARDLQEALGICRDLGDRPGQAHRPHQPGEHAAADRGLPRRGPGPAGGTGHLPGPRRPARPGPRPHHPRGDVRGRPGTTRTRSGTCRRHWASAGTSATGAARPAPSPSWGAGNG